MINEQDIAERSKREQIEDAEQIQVQVTEALQKAFSLLQGIPDNHLINLEITSNLGSPNTELSLNNFDVKSDEVKFKAEINQNADMEDADKKAFIEFILTQGEEGDVQIEVWPGEPFASSILEAAHGKEAAQRSGSAKRGYGQLRLVPEDIFTGNGRIHIPDYKLDLDEKRTKQLRAIVKFAADLTVEQLQGE